MPVTHSTWVWCVHSCSAHHNLLEWAIVVEIINYQVLITWRKKIIQHKYKITRYKYLNNNKYPTFPYIVLTLHWDSRE